MENDAIAENLALTARLLDLHGENPFKIKALTQAADLIEKLPESILSKDEKEWAAIKGIGKGIIAKLIEMRVSSTTTELEELIKKTPPGLLTLLDLAGMGPKKTKQVWEELGIESIGELQYACNENRLISLKGFGEKTQSAILKNIAFKLESSGSCLFAKVEQNIQPLTLQLDAVFGKNNWSFTGEFFRKCEIISKIEVLVIQTNGQAFPVWEKPCNLDVVLIPTAPQYFSFNLLKTSCTKEHWSLLGEPEENAATPEEIYSSIGLPLVAVEMRENFDLATLKQIAKTSEELIKVEQLKGGLHMHSTWSDGLNTLEEMAIACKNKGWEYLGICDHSQSAFYANGLKPDRVLAQHQEIEMLNKKFFPFVIYKGIESDILHDGSLDYSEEILKTFDFVVASVHSGLKMDIEKATTRLIKAIENPTTRILGHMTGRLLLSREGYPLHTKKVIDACAQNKVCIELNAHPYRLDIDWRWLPYCLEKDVLISINPDAHHIHGIHDVQYGVNVARKGGLTSSCCLNSKTNVEFAEWIKNKK